MAIFYPPLTNACHSNWSDMRLLHDNFRADVDIDEEPASHAGSLEQADKHMGRSNDYVPWGQQTVRQNGPQQLAGWEASGSRSTISSNMSLKGDEDC